MDDFGGIRTDRLQYDVVTVCWLLIFNNIQELFAVLSLGLIGILLFAKFTFKVFPEVSGDVLRLFYDSFLCEPLL